MGNNQTEKLMNSIKTIQVRNYEQKIDVIKFVSYQNLNTILTQNNLIDENWYKINKILLTKQSDKILIIKIIMIR